MPAGLYVHSPSNLLQSANKLLQLQLLLLRQRLPSGRGPASSPQALPLQERHHWSGAVRVYDWSLYVDSG